MQIQQVLLNLVMNALDAVESLPPVQRRIVVSTRAVEDGAEVSVRDFGSGLPKDRPEKVFDHFFSTKTTGMGMGLTIVRSIVESHAGKIRAENAAGWWRALYSPVTCGPPGSAEPGGMSAREESAEVCLVDDDASVLRSMEFLLKSDGIKVRAFNKPEKFVAYAAKHRVPVVVTDIWMDHVTGLEILARTCALKPRPQVIVITAGDDVAARATVMQIGPAAFFNKPFDDEKFLAAVHDALRRASEQQAD